MDGTYLIAAPRQSAYGTVNDDLLCLYSTVVLGSLDNLSLYL
jgi:hypothetical protein